MQKKTPHQPTRTRPALSVVVLASGGMDSTTALYQATQTHHVVGALSFHYGSKHNAREIPYARYHCKKLGIPHQVIRLGFMDRLFQSALLASGGEIPDGRYEPQNMHQTVVPFRNGILLAIAAGYAESIGAKGLVIAAHSGDHALYPDCRENFMRAMEQAIRYGTYAQLTLLRPFIDCDKSQIVQQGMALGIDYSKTWSCYKGQKIHCGTCGTCLERKAAFRTLGQIDPTHYAIP